VAEEKNRRVASAVSAEATSADGRTAPAELLGGKLVELKVPATAAGEESPYIPMHRGRMMPRIHRLWAQRVSQGAVTMAGALVALLLVLLLGPVVIQSRLVLGVLGLVVAWGLAGAAWLLTSNEVAVDDLPAPGNVIRLSVRVLGVLVAGGALVGTVGLALGIPGVVAAGEGLLWLWPLFHVMLVWHLGVLAARIGERVAYFVATALALTVGGVALVVYGSVAQRLWVAGLVTGADALLMEGREWVWMVLVLVNAALLAYMWSRLVDILLHKL